MHGKFNSLVMIRSMMEQTKPGDSNRRMSLDEIELYNYHREPIYTKVDNRLSLRQNPLDAARKARYAKK